MSWFYTSAGQQMGPVEETRLQQLYAAGTVTADSLVWRQGMEAWRPYRVVFLGASPAVATQYGGFWIRVLASIVDALIVGVASSIVQAPFSFMAGGLGRTLERADSFTDLAALPLMFGAIGMAWALGIAVDGAYHIYFVATRGATPGKLMLNLRVIRTDGQPISYGLATGRWLASYLSMFTLCIGYVIAAFDSQKRTLHDHICDTRVVKIPG